MLKPYPFQKDDSIRAFNQNLLCANETGTGKTIIAIESIIKTVKSVQYDKKLSRLPILVIVPKPIRSQWKAALEEQFNRTSLLQSNGSRITRWVICGTDFEVNPEDSNSIWYHDYSSIEPATEIIDIPIEEDFYVRGIQSICVTNHENIRANDVYFQDIEWLDCTLDEAHKISNQANKVSKALKLLKIYRKRALTGTPFDRNPSKIWSILNWLSPMTYNSYDRFERTHTLFRGNKVIGCRNHALFAADIAAYTVRRTKREIWADLPEKVEEVIKLPLLPKQAKAYATVLQALNNELLMQSAEESSDGEDKTFSVFGLLALITRCQQATSLPSGIKNKDGYHPFYDVVESSKVDWTINYVKEMVARNNGDDFQSQLEDAQATLTEVGDILGIEDNSPNINIGESDKAGDNGHIEKVYVICSFIDTALEIIKRLSWAGIPASKITGGMRREVFDSELSRFKSTDWGNPNRTDVAVTIIEAGGTGIDIPMVDTEIFVDTEYSSIKMLQASDRIRDSFTQKKVLYYITCENTIDEVTLDAFRHKRSEQKFIFNAVELAQKGYEITGKKKRGRPANS